MRTVLRLMLVGFALTALAQVGAQPPPAKDKDPQSSFEPRGAPGAGQKYLQRFVGDWDVAKSFSRARANPLEATEHASKP